LIPINSTKFFIVSFSKLLGDQYPNPECLQVGASTTRQSLHSRKAKKLSAIALQRKETTASSISNVALS
jgi:hypothetical protein